MPKMSRCFLKPSQYKNQFTILDFNVLESGEVQWTSIVKGQPPKVCPPAEENEETMFDRCMKLIPEKKKKKSTNVENTSAESTTPTTTADSSTTTTIAKSSKPNASASSVPSSCVPIRPNYPEPEFRRIAPRTMDVANMLRIAKADFEIFINKKGRRKYKFDFIGKVYERKEKKSKDKKEKSTK